MTWTKLPDTFYDDPVLLGVSRDARLLHVEVLTWCNKFGTDGVVPAARIGRITDSPEVERAAAELVEAALWEVAGDGWQIVGFTDEQPSAEDVAKVRTAAKARQQSLRRRRQLHDAGDHSECLDSCWAKRDQRGESRRDQRSPVPTRPDPKGGKGRDWVASLPLADARSASRPEERAATTFTITAPTRKSPGQ